MFGPQSRLGPRQHLVPVHFLLLNQDPRVCVGLIVVIFAGFALHLNLAPVSLQLFNLEVVREAWRALWPEFDALADLALFLLQFLVMQCSWLEGQYNSLIWAGRQWKLRTSLLAKNMVISVEVLAQPVHLLVHVIMLLPLLRLVLEVEGLLFLLGLWLHMLHQLVVKEQWVLSLLASMVSSFAYLIVNWFTLQR